MPRRSPTISTDWVRPGSALATSGTSERDGWIPLHGMMPDHAGAWLAEKSACLDDPEFTDLHRRFDRAFDWEPEDPPPGELVDRLVDWSRRHATAVASGGEETGDPALFQMISDATGVASPAWQRMIRLAQERSEH